MSKSTEQQRFESFARVDQELQKPARGVEAIAKKLAGVNDPQVIYDFLTIYAVYSRMFRDAIKDLLSGLESHGEALMPGPEGRDVLASIHDDIQVANQDEQNPLHEQLSFITLASIEGRYHLQQEHLQPVFINSTVNADIAAIKKLHRAGHGLSLEEVLAVNARSENLADQEFKLLQKLLSENFPELWEYLQRDKITIPAGSAYGSTWITAHAEGLEEEHKKAAGHALWTCLEYCAPAKIAPTENGFKAGIASFNERHEALFENAWTYRGRL